jgi:transposase
LRTGFGSVTRIGGIRVGNLDTARNVYLRRMLIHGARAALLRVKYNTAGFGQKVHRLAQRPPRNKVIVAIANNLACEGLADTVSVQEAHA